jgi:ADP-ribosylglycohydrolase
MLVELAIGDSYGAGFEMADEDFVEANNNLQYVNHRKNLSLVKTGHYTDDTQMTLAIAEALLEDDPFTPLSIAERFVQCFHRDERRGYNGGFFKFLLDTKDGETFLENIRPDSEKSGAAMRASPLGLLSDRREIKRLCDIQAALTHDTPAGHTSAYCAALMVYYFKNEMGRPKADLGGWLADQCQVPQLEQPWAGPRVRSLGWHCVHAAIRAVTDENTLADVLRRSVAFTGDVDTVATIAMAAAVWSKDIEQNIPQHLYDNLENGKYGRDYLVELDKKLLEKYQ